MTGQKCFCFIDPFVVKCFTFWLLLFNLCFPLSFFLAHTNSLFLLSPHAHSVNLNPFPISCVCFVFFLLLLLLLLFFCYLTWTYLTAHDLSNTSQSIFIANTLHTHTHKTLIFVSVLHLFRCSIPCSSHLAFHNRHGARITTNPSTKQSERFEKRPL